MKAILRVFAVVVLGPGLLAIPGQCAAADPGAGEETSVCRGMSVLGGFSKANLDGQEHYEHCPVILRFTLDPRPVTRKVGLELSENWDFNIEPYFSQVFSPGNDFQVGCLLFARWSHSVFTPMLRFYLEAGAGPMHMSTPTLEQSTYFNFLDQVGMGAIYHVAEDTNVELGYRFWHISNGSLDSPNRGIEGNTVHFGLTRRF